ncbi:DUF1062 domain-containing protein [Mesorhizobium sp. M2D.F.Ca.ET.185.01.1.1]|uniref:DUF1062 domain-containing protein n=1 Tax=unclassified Mesorhizobium TaxID=325217 RepID=UPI000FCB2043|nr:MULTISPECIES: DUF1062 domain-containing protein [unclassified Mesorhizobium]TGP45570.1 DUF1062 domain-containing protein [bacterium M00.F.Ca.ET.230.01.1.1]TGP73264.1 DUF1062 domain-containing protein [bacterium M00.F.Ca.ET.227.01.1.1]TGP84205.1 DUF1062 domain-containing protein [bacterium M00.F.Ca.ET.221.01.1.1]TGP86895.1 DUF1062 domain-containing protein [bacterium M00.F.Ca.ET.222.01.1.1]TGT66021.1 DUF1062 domain-containing protein [bacterium M00.F.Ca.ET.159.01.1.1]TGT79706.1 DUF1062 doma
MSSTLFVRWTIAPAIAPRPLINCNRCGGVRPYKYSEKFRVNANGKRIDVWLIYRCTGCDNSWNRTILERCNRRDIEPALLAAFESNDPAFVRRHAFDTVALRSRIGRIEEFPDVAVRKELLDGRPECAVALSLELRLDAATSLRLDRLLAGELGISRSRLQVWEERRLLIVSPDGGRAWRKPVRDGATIRIDLAGEADRGAIVGAACD